jgi:glycerate 2-kinase
MREQAKHPQASPHYQAHHMHMAQIQRAALSAADPFSAVARNLGIEDEILRAGGHVLQLTTVSRIYLIGLGKASPGMCRAAAEILDDRLVAGIAAVPHHFEGNLAPSIQAHRAGHPLPDEGSLAAGQAVANLLASTTPEDLVVAVISGGGSAMLELPVTGVHLGDLRALNTLLLQSGAPIQAINTVRRALSQIKSGGLARLAAPARVVALILSDVVGDRLSAIASGPTVLRRPSPLEARAVLDAYCIWDQAPTSVRTALSAPAEPTGRSRRPTNILVGSNRLVIEAAARSATALGFQVRVVSRNMHGEAKVVGERFARRLKHSSGPVCLLMGGETTVTVRGDGLGGRNQELALSAALALEGVPNVALMALATDGVDGPTDAAGALISGETGSALRRLGVDPERALANNDAYRALDAVRGLLRPGPTDTNLNDLVVGLVYP